MVQVYPQTLPVFLKQNHVSRLVFSWLRGGWLLALAQQLDSYKDCSKGVFFKYILLVYACVSPPMQCAKMWLKNLLGFYWKKNFSGVLCVFFVIPFCLLKKYINGHVIILLVLSHIEGELEYMVTWLPDTDYFRFELLLCKWTACTFRPSWTMG